MLSSHIVGQVIAEYREKRSISQEVLSGLAGIARTHLSMIENGKRKPTLETFYRICRSIGVKPSVVMAEIERREERENVKFL